MRLSLHLDASDGVRQQLARELAARLSREPGIAAELAPAAPSPGSKGDPITIGAIVLSALGSGGAIASMIGVFKSYIERHPKIRFELEREGTKFSIAAEDLTPDQLAHTTRLMERLFPDSE